jgi:hypothetical protein
MYRKSTEFEGRVTSEGHGEARRFTPGGARGSLRRVSVVPIARRIEALEPLKALYAKISATGG